MQVNLRKNNGGLVQLNTGLPCGDSYCKMINDGKILLVFITDP